MLFVHKQYFNYVRRFKVQGLRRKRMGWVPSANACVVTVVLFLSKLCYLSRVPHEANLRERKGARSFLPSFCVRIVDTSGEGTEA